MRVHRDALGQAEGVAEDDVGRLAADPGEPDQGVELARDLASVVLDQAPGAADQASPWPGRSRWSG